MIVFCCSTWLGLFDRKKNCKWSVCANMLILYVCTYCSLSIHYSCCLYYENYSLHNPLLAAETLRLRIKWLLSLELGKNFWKHNNKIHKK